MASERLLLCAWPCVAQGSFSKSLNERLAYELTHWSEASTGFLIHAANRGYAEESLRFIQGKTKSGACKALLQGKLLTADETCVLSTPCPTLWPGVRTLAEEPVLPWVGQFSDTFRMIRLRIREIARKEGCVLDLYPSCSWELARKRAWLMWVKNALQAARQQGPAVQGSCSANGAAQVGSWKTNLPVDGGEALLRELLQECARLMHARARDTAEGIVVEFSG